MLKMNEIRVKRENKGWDFGYHRGFHRGRIAIAIVAIENAKERPDLISTRQETSRLFWIVQINV